MRIWLCTFLLLTSLASAKVEFVAGPSLQPNDIIRTRYSFQKKYLPFLPDQFVWTRGVEFGGYAYAFAYDIDMMNRRINKKIQSVEWTFHGITFFFKVHRAQTTYSCRLFTYRDLNDDSNLIRYQINVQNDGQCKIEFIAREDASA